MQHSFNSLATATGSGNLLNLTYTRGFARGHGQRLANSSAAGHPEADQPKLLLYCAGLVAAVPSLIGMPSSATSTLCAKKNGRKGISHDAETTVKTSNRKKKKVAESDEEYVNEEPSDEKTDRSKNEGMTPITKFFGRAATAMKAQTQVGGGTNDMHPSTPRRTSKRTNKLMTRTPPAQVNRLNRYKTERQLEEREKSGFNKGGPGVETDRDATKRSRRPRKIKETKTTSDTDRLSRGTQDHQVNQRGHRASAAGGRESRTVQTASAIDSASGSGGRDVNATEPTHTPPSANTTSMPAGANTALYAVRPRGRAAREEELTTNSVESVSKHEVVRTTLYVAHPVGSAIRHDHVQGQVLGDAPRRGKLSGAMKKTATKVTARKSLRKGKAKFNSGGPKTRRSKECPTPSSPPKIRSASRATTTPACINTGFKIPAVTPATALKAGATPHPAGVKETPAAQRPADEPSFLVRTGRLLKKGMEKINDLLPESEGADSSIGSGTNEDNSPNATDEWSLNPEDVNGSFEEEDYGEGYLNSKPDRSDDTQDGDPGDFDDDVFNDDVPDDDINDHVGNDIRRAQPLSPEHTEGIREDFDNEFDFGSTDGDDTSSDRDRLSGHSSRRTSRDDSSISTVGRTTSTEEADGSDGDDGLSTWTGQSGRSTGNASYNTQDCDASSGATSGRAGSRRSSSISGLNEHSVAGDLTSDSENSDRGVRRGRRFKKGNYTSRGSHSAQTDSDASDDDETASPPYYEADPPSRSGKENDEEQSHSNEKQTNDQNDKSPGRSMSREAHSTPKYSDASSDAEIAPPRHNSDPPFQSSEENVEEQRHRGRDQENSRNDKSSKAAKTFVQKSASEKKQVGSRAQRDVANDNVPSRHKDPPCGDDEHVKEKPQRNRSQGKNHHSEPGSTVKIGKQSRTVREAESELGGNGQRHNDSSAAKRAPRPCERDNWSERMSTERTSHTNYVQDKARRKFEFKIGDIYVPSSDYRLAVRNKWPPTTVVELLLHLDLQRLNHEDPGTYNSLIPLAYTELLIRSNLIDGQYEPSELLLWMNPMHGTHVNAFR